MRYLWLIFFLFVIGIGAIFVHQNQEPVAVNFALDWINFDLGLNRTPLFIPILIALAFGMIITTVYLFFYHLYLQLKVRSQSSEIYRLKRLVILERQKDQRKKQMATHAINRTTEDSTNSDELVINGESTETDHLAQNKLSS